ncbi:MAG: hypothetical protein AB7F43_13665 [Bacteriovoracia bacterium]
MLFEVKKQHLDTYGFLHSPIYFDFLETLVPPGKHSHAEISLLRPVRLGETVKLTTQDNGEFFFHLENDLQGKPTAAGSLHGSGSPLESTLNKISPASPSEWLLYETVEEQPIGSIESGPNFGFGDAVEVLAKGRWRFCEQTLGLTAKEIVKAGYAFVASRFEVLNLNPVPKAQIKSIRMRSRVDKVVRPNTHLLIQFELINEDNQESLTKGWMNIVSIQLATGKPSDFPEHYWKFLKKSN